MINLFYKHKKIKTKMLLFHNNYIQNSFSLAGKAKIVLYSTFTHKWRQTFFFLRGWTEIYVTSSIDNCLQEKSTFMWQLKCFLNRQNFAFTELKCLIIMPYLKCFSKSENPLLVCQNCGRIHSRDQATVVATLLTLATITERHLVAKSTNYLYFKDNSSNDSPP